MAPGLVVLKGPIDRIRQWKGTLMGLSLLENADCEVSCGDWLNAFLTTRYQKDNAMYQGDDGVSVLLDGYISDVDTILDNDPRNDPAKAVARLYRAVGRTFAERLRGSFSGLLVDSDQSKAILFRDRRGSRPLFYTANEKQSLVVAPDSRLVAKLRSRTQAIEPASVCEFLISGRNWSDHTLFAGVSKLPQACLMEFDEHSHHVGRYWRVSFDEHVNSNSYEEIVDEGERLIQQSTRRLLLAVDNPFLFLSGGLDSRVVLASLIKEGAGRIPLVAYGSDADSDSDVAVARDLAASLGSEIECISQDYVDWPAHATRVAQEFDGLVEVVDAPGLMGAWRQLSKKYDSFFNGDECFGWRPAVATRAEALNNNMMFYFGQVSRLIDWVQKDQRGDIQSALNGTLNALISDSIYDDPTIFRDAIYFEERIANEVNSIVATQARYFEQARPLVDEDVVEFVSRLPKHHRTSKKLFLDILAKTVPDLGKVRVAGSMSIPTAITYQKMLSTDSVLAKFFLSEIDSLVPALNRFLNADKIGNLVMSLHDKGQFPSVTLSWKHRLPGAWRFKALAPENAVHPISLVLRVMQVNWFLKGL